jgi:hypothetical protein
MAIINIAKTDTFEDWRSGTNSLGTIVGDISAKDTNSGTEPDIITTINNLRAETDNNYGWIGLMANLFNAPNYSLSDGTLDGTTSSYTNLTEAANRLKTDADTRQAEIGNVHTLTHYSTYPTLVGTLNSHDSRLDTAEATIGTIGSLDASLQIAGTDNLVAAINKNKDFINQISSASGISLTTTFGEIYDGTQTSVSGALNNDYARLNTLSNLIGGTQSNGSTSAANVQTALYGTHTNLVAAIQGIEQFPLTNSLWDGTDNQTLIGALNNHEARLDTEENNIDLLQGDVGTWSNFDGTEATITEALDAHKDQLDLVDTTYVNASGDSMTGNLNFSAAKGIFSSSTGATTYLHIGHSANTIRINGADMVGIGKNAHDLWKVDVSGTLNATDLKIGGESLDDRFLEVNTVSGWDEVGAQVKFNNNVTFADEVKIGTETIYHSASTFTETVQDISGTMFTGNTESGGISAVYDDGTGKVTLAIANNGHTHTTGNITGLAEYIQDTAGGMFTGNTESGITAVYQDGDGTIDLNVNDPVFTFSGDIELDPAHSAGVTMTNLGNVNFPVVMTSNAVTLGTNTTGSYMLDVNMHASNNKGMSISHTNSEGSTATISSNATNLATANTLMYRDGSANFKANTAYLDDITLDAGTGYKLTMTGGSAATDYSGIKFNSGTNAGSDFGFIYYRNDTTTYEPWKSSGNTSNECSELVIGTQNDTSDVNGDILVLKGTAATVLDSPSLRPPTNNSKTVGTSTYKFAGMYATTFYGNATSANYADLAENYLGDNSYEVGTVLALGGPEEVTMSSTDHDRKVIGVVSEHPAYLMNNKLEGEFVTTIALTGRVPCKVSGSIKKGDMMVSDGSGRARAEDDPKYGSAIGKALEDSEGDNIIEVIIGK